MGPDCQEFRRAVRMSTSQPGAHAGAGAPQTLAQKLVARAAGRTEVTVGEIVVCRIDVAMFHDSSGPRRLKPMLEQLGATIWDRSRVVLITDHYVPEKDEEARQILRMTREWASAMALPHFYDNMGICHIVLPEQGHLRPGLFCVGGDSHSTTGGAFGAYMFGVGATEMLGAVTTGEIWVQVPPTLEMRWNGRLAPGVSAKDMMLHMIGRFGMNGGNYGAVEFSGEAVRALGMQERMTLSNMSAELGAQVGLVAPDDTTAIWLRDIGARAAEPGEWFTDPGADTVLHQFNAATLSPQIAAPHSPANTSAVEEMAGTAVDVAYIGACTGAKLEDLRAASRILRGRRVASHVDLVVAPASARDQAQAQSEGTLQALIDAGARLQPNSCGACAGYGATLPADATVVSTTARNFKGRMGPASTQVYLASPYTVAASALRGCITDPRAYLQ